MPLSFSSSAPVDDAILASSALHNETSDVASIGNSPPYGASRVARAVTESAPASHIAIDADAVLGSAALSASRAATVDTGAAVRVSS